MFGPEVDVEAAKHDIKHAIEEQGGRLPAEHGHGTEYYAPADTQVTSSKTKCPLLRGPLWNHFQESPRQTKPKKGPKRKAHEFRPFL